MIGQNANHFLRSVTPKLANNQAECGAMLLQRVQEALSRTRGSFVASSIEARFVPRMGVGVVAKERVPKDTLVLQASVDAWYPLSSECAVEQAQRQAPQFLEQLEQLFASAPVSPFVPNAVLLGVHMLINYPRSTAPQHLLLDSTLDTLYAHSLPDLVPDLPFYWHESQLLQLEGCVEARRTIDHGTRFYNQIYDNLFGTQNTFVTRESFFWAISILMSRATSGNDQPFALIPFFDWFNHADDGRECVQEFDPQQGFTVRTTRAYEPGEQLCINYGRHNNLRLLRNYGFTLPSNPLDIVSIPLPTDLQDLKLNDPAINQKIELLRALQLDTKRSLRSLEVTQAGDLTPQSRHWLQLSLASSEDLQSLFEQASMTNSTKKTAHEETLQLPAGLKKQVDDHIRAICTTRLSQHTSTLERDEDFLKANSTEMASSLRSCLHLRIGEKRALIAAINKTVEARQ